LEIAPAREPDITNPPAPAPLPKYLRSKTDFAILATSPKFQLLLKRHPALLSRLQLVYAKTIEPERPGARGVRRGRGMRGRGWGRGGGGRGRGRRDDSEFVWTPRKGDADAMKGLKKVREGLLGDEEKLAMAEFVELVDNMFGAGVANKNDASKQDLMDTS
jgi:zinc finger HIT domain-containing protein 3